MPYFRPKLRNLYKFEKVKSVLVLLSIGDLFSCLKSSQSNAGRNERNEKVKIKQSSHNPCVVIQSLPRAMELTLCQHRSYYETSPIHADFKTNCQESAVP